MTVFSSGNDIFQTDGSRVVWSTTRRPALLVPDAAVVLTNFNISFPDLQKSNAYGYAIGSGPGGFTQTSCVSFVTVIPQEWNSGLSLVATLPSACNYFEVSVNLTRVDAPSNYLGFSFPRMLQEGADLVLDGHSAIVERAGPIVRLFRFERVGNQVFLRRKQSVNDGGVRVPWNSGNSTTFPNGGQRPGWTYGPQGQLGWPVHQIQTKGPGGDVNKNRGQGNQCSLSDPTNYASIWRGAVTITPGYIAP